MVGRAVTDGRGGLRPDVGQGLLLSVVVRESGTVIESTFTCGLISECWGVTSCACLIAYLGLQYSTLRYKRTGRIIVLVCKPEQPIEFAEPEACLLKSPIAGLGDANPLKYSASPAPAKPSASKMVDSLLSKSLTTTSMIRESSFGTLQEYKLRCIALR